MPFCDNSSGNIATAIALLFAGTLYICFSPRSISDPLFLLQQNSTPQPLRTIDLPVDKLDEALDRAAAGNNKTVIIAMVNEAYVEESGKEGGGRTMMDLFLESFWEGEGTRPLLDHLMVVAVDQTSYDRCRFRRLHCYRLETEGVDFAGEKVYMSEDFIKMMWRRTLLLLDVLRRGYHIVFTDTDVMWLRNPFSTLSNNARVDMQISVDSRVGHFINTGFYHVRSNNRTVSLFQKWYDMRLNSTGMKEQDVLKNLLDAGFFDYLGLTVGFLNTTQFSGFCQDSPDIGAVTTVHANCCRHIPAKVFDLTVVLRDWKRYKDFVARSHGGHNRKGKAMRFKWTPHVKCWGSWNDTHYNPNL